MVLAIDTTPGGTASNSYVTVAEADAYFAAILGFTTLWTAMAEQTKIARLIAAARAIDRMQFSGYLVVTDQAMAFPRTTDVTIEQRILDEDYGQVHERVKRAQMEMVIHHYADQSTTTGRSSTVREKRRVKVDGVVEIEYADAGERESMEAVAGGSLATVLSLLAPWLQGGASGEDSTFEFSR